MELQNGESKKVKKSDGVKPFDLIRYFFGIFMIVMYFGVAYLLFIDFFRWGEISNPQMRMLFHGFLRWTMIIVLVPYGIYRCYRQVKGTDYYRLKKDDDVEEVTLYEYKTRELIERVKNEEKE